jgi:hypothetical protein
MAEGENAEAQAETVIGADGIDEARLIAMLDGDSTAGAAAETEPEGAAAETEPDGDAGNAEPEVETEAEEPEGDEDEGTGTKTAREKLSPEVQAILDKRIGKEVAKRKTLEDQVEAERSAKTAAEAERDELRARLETAAVQPAAGPAELYASAKAVEEREERVWNLLEFARKHADGFDGDEKNGIPAYTAEQMRDAATRYERELFRDLPRVKGVLAQREQFDAAVTAKVYPQLLDPKTPEAKIADRFLRKYPQLRMEPDVLVLIGDMIAGERARKAQGEKKDAVKPGVKPAGKSVVKAPAGQPVAGIGGKPQEKGLGMKTLAERGFSREALAEALD